MMMQTKETNRTDSERKRDREKETRSQRYGVKTLCADWHFGRGFSVANLQLRSFVYWMCAHLVCVYIRSPVQHSTNNPVQSRHTVSQYTSEIICIEIHLYA